MFNDITISRHDRRLCSLRLFLFCFSFSARGLAFSSQQPTLHVSFQLFMSNFYIRLLTPWSLLRLSFQTILHPFSYSRRQTEGVSFFRSATSHYSTPRLSVDCYYGKCHKYVTVYIYIYIYIFTWVLWLNEPQCIYSHPQTDLFRPIRTHQFGKTLASRSWDRNPVDSNANPSL